MGLVQRLLVCFGNGAHGRLGLGFPMQSQWFPRLVNSLVGYSVTQVSCGGAYTAAVTEDGSLFSFGMNDAGQLGHSRKDPYVAVPIEVGVPDRVVQVSAGDYHTLVLTEAGEVWAFGSNSWGQLGIGRDDKGPVYEPRLVKALSGTRIKAVEAGAEHSLALTSQGELLSWGRGDFGVLGCGPVHPNYTCWTPARVSGLPRIVSICAGYYNSGAIDPSGNVFTWGNGILWSLGLDSNNREFSPRQIQECRPMSSISLAMHHGMGLGTEGTTYIWGMDENGSLGQGEGKYMNYPLTIPTRMDRLPGARQVSVGWKHSAIVTRDGRLFTWGSSGLFASGMFRDSDMGGGQLGIGIERDHWEPTQVSRIRTSRDSFLDNRTATRKPWKALSVSCGRNHTAAIIEAEIAEDELLAPHSIRAS